MKIAVMVAGATRGLWRGIARGLASRGAPAAPFTSAAGANT